MIHKTVRVSEYACVSDKIGKEMLIVPCGKTGGKCIFKLTRGGAIVQLGQWDETDEIFQELRQALIDDARANPETILDPGMGGNSFIMVPYETGGLYTQDGRYTKQEHMFIMQRPVFDRLMAGGDGELVPLFAHVHQYSWRGNTARKPYDIIVRCLGWKQDRAMYDTSNGVNPDMDITMMGKKEGKYAAMTAEFESVNTPGLFFAGALGHGLDWRKSSGGFIHGFRYTARALSVRSHARCSLAAAFLLL